MICDHARNTLRISRIVPVDCHRTELRAEQPDFRCAFDAARQRIKEMEVQFVEETDSIRQALLEIYTAMKVRAQYNDFDNH